MLRRIAQSPQLQTAVRTAADALKPAGASQLQLAGDGPLAGLAARNPRPVSTVAQPTETKMVDGEARVTSPGHVQFQPSAQDLLNNPRLAPALGHSPVASREQRETFPVRGTLSDGTPFNVTGVRNQAKNAGDDVPLKHNAKTIVIDHGDMTPEQSARYEQAQRQPVFPNYETSGLDGANCVAAHLELTRQVFGHDPGPLHPHATPQEAARAVETLKTQ